MKKKSLLLLTAASTLAIAGGAASIFAFNGENIYKVQAEPTLRTLVLNEAPTVVADRFSVKTSSGTNINFIVDGSFVPGGTFGTLNPGASVTVSYDQESDVLFSNLYSITIDTVGDGSYFAFYYCQNKTIYSYSNDGVAYDGVELLVSEHQVQIYDDPYASSTHTGNPNIFQYYSAGMTVEINSITIKYTC